jgi:hypothetical protein
VGAGGAEGGRQGKLLLGQPAGLAGVAERERGR